METILTYSFAFIFGSILGSFLNVVILRYQTGRSALEGRSVCFHCNTPLRWYELIPILSFLYARGRCRTCRVPISLQYPLVESGTGLLFVLVVAKNLAFSETIYVLSTISILIVIFVYDIRHKIIPNAFVYAFILLSFFHLFVDFSLLDVRIPGLYEIAAGPLLFLPFFLLWYFSKGTWMGFGDAKLSTGIGFSLGLTKGITAVVFAFWAGAAASLAAMIGVFVVQRLGLLARGKRLTMKSEIPFAPFLIIGFFIVFIFNIDLFALF